MSEIEDLKRLTQQEHAVVLLTLGDIKETLGAFGVNIAAAKDDRQEFRLALADIDLRLRAHVAELRQYRNWIIGFSAGITLIFSTVWASGIEFMKALFSR